ncbi:MAG TPA: hypothetical protein VHX68_05310, partial [Planctomycetaceae bacterium]|nr:hypothetical protein [Planctomycetaceae bacterium]
MRIDCPTCGTRIPAAQIDLNTESATCPSCGAAFSLAALVPGQAAARSSDRRLERPYDARAIDESSLSEVNIRVPPVGIGRAILLLLLAAVYLTIVAGWTIGAFNPGHNPLGWNVIIVSVGLLMSILGLGPIGLALWATSGVLTLRIDQRTALFETRCLFVHFAQEIALEELKCAQPEETITFNSFATRSAKSFSLNRPAPSVAIVYRDGSFLVPVSTDA